MFDAVAMTSCEIVKFGWSKDKAPVDTFIMGLASSIRERNDYDEQVCMKSFFCPFISSIHLRHFVDFIYQKS